MRAFFLLFITITVASRSGGRNGNSKELDRFAWLAGEWIIPGEIVSHEYWSRSMDGSYTGIGYAMKGADTVFLEHLSVISTDSGIFYVPVVRGQNGDKPVFFRMVTAAGEQFVFENKVHDFPQRIVYTHPLQDSLYAYIEGVENGVSKKIDFSMKRLK